MLIDHTLGDLAKATKFRRAWNETFGNSSGPLWARFFRYSKSELQIESCRPLLERSGKANLRWMNRLKWDRRLEDICRAITPDLDLQIRASLRLANEMGPMRMHRQQVYNMLVTTSEGRIHFALAVARWQARNGFRRSSIDGVVGPGTWRAMQEAMVAV